MYEVQKASIGNENLSQQSRSTELMVDSKSDQASTAMFMMRSPSRATETALHAKFHSLTIAFPDAVRFVASVIVRFLEADGPAGDEGRSSSDASDRWTMNVAP